MLAFEIKDNESHTPTTRVSALYARPPIFLVGQTFDTEKNIMGVFA